MMSRPWFAAFFAVAVSTPAVALDVAVLPVAGSAPPTERSAMTSALRQELQALGIEVQAGDVTARTIADAATFGAECAVIDPTCALQLGGVAGVDRVVVAALDGGRLILRLHDVVGQRELQRVTVPAASSSPTKAARLGAIRLVAPERETGTLAVEVDVAGATVLVDGVERGVAPLGPLSLRAGSHEVAVGHPEHTTQTLVVEVAFDEVTPVVVSMRSGPPRRPAGQADTVYVLDAVVDGYPPLTAALITAMTQDALGGRDGLVVVPPDTVARVVDTDTLARLKSCGDDACAVAALRPRFQRGDVLFVDVEAIGTGSRLSLRRRSLSPDRTSKDDVVERISPVDADGRAAAGVLGEVVAQVYPRQAHVDVVLLPDRFGPPPLAVSWLAAPGAIAAVGTAVAVVGGIMLAGASDEAARPPLLAATVVGASAAIVGAIGVGVMVPFVDWDDLQGENARLLQARADRPMTR